MPALIFLGRKCRIGSDDLYYPTYLCMLYQLPVVLLTWLYFGVLQTCATTEFNETGIIFYYMLGSSIIFTLLLVIEAMILHVSSKGTILECENRSLVVPMLVIHLFLSITQLLYSLMGFYLYWDHFDELCNPDSHFLIITNVLMALDVLSSLIFFCVTIGGSAKHRDHHTERRDPYQSGKVAFNERQSLLSDHDESPEDIHLDMLSPLQKTWEKRCTCFCTCFQCVTCNLFGGHGTRHNSDSVSVVAGVLARLFFGNPDLVLSDLAAGFVLLGAVQASEEEELTSVEINLSYNKVDATVEDEIKSKDSEDDSTILLRQNGSSSNQLVQDPQLIEEISELAYYSRYAIGIYGWMLYVWSHPWTGVSRLAISSCRRKQGLNVYGDTFMSLHRTSFLLETGLLDADILYAQFDNNVCQPAFCIAMDRVKKCIVLSIRGTLSLEDCLTDVLAHSQSLEQVGRTWGFDGSRGYAHQGMLQAAEYVVQQIVDSSIFEILFEGREPTHLFSDIDLPDCSNFGLKVVGHSLGAGTAVLVAMMLRPKYKFIKALAFSPPGCVLSKEHAQLSESFVNTCVIGRDIIARASLLSMYQCRDQILDLIQRSKVNKKDIFNQVVSWRPTNELLNESDDVSNAGPRHKDLKNYRAMLQRLRDIDATEELCMPGKIVHFIQKDSRDTSGYCVCCLPGREVCCTDRSDYIPRRVHHSHFATIRIGRTMLDDHFPDKVHYVLQDYIQRNKDDGDDNSLGV